MYEHVKTGCKHIPPSEQPLQFQSRYFLNKPRMIGVWAIVQRIPHKCVYYEVFFGNFSKTQSYIIQIFALF